MDPRTITSMSDVIGSVTSAPGRVVSAVHGLLSLSRPSRLRRHLSETLVLYERTQRYDALERSSADLVEIASIQSRRLREHANSEALQEQLSKRHWPTTLTAASVAVGLAFLDRALIPTGNSPWWAWPLFVVFLFITLLFLMATIQLARGVQVETKIVGPLPIEQIAPELVSHGLTSANQPPLR